MQWHSSAVKLVGKVDVAHQLFNGQHQPVLFVIDPLISELSVSALHVLLLAAMHFLLKVSRNIFLD